MDDIEEWELRATCRLSTELIASLAVSYERTTCHKLSGLGAAGELVQGNWIQLRDGIIRVKVPTGIRRLRPGLSLVASREIALTGTDEALRIEESVMHRWTLQLHDELLTGCVMTCSCYLRPGQAYAGLQQCMVECEFPIVGPSNEAVLAAEVAVLMIAGSPLIPAIDKVQTPDVLPISAQKAEEMERLAQLGPFSAKTNGYHMVAWPDRTGLLFVRPAQLPARWRLMPRELNTFDTRDTLFEVERLPSGVMILLSDLSSGRIADHANSQTSWAEPKMWHHSSEAAEHEAARLGKHADGVIGLMFGSPVKP